MSDTQTVLHLQSVIHDNTRSLDERAKAETLLAELYLTPYAIPEWCKERLLDSFGELSTFDHMANELINRYQVADETESFRWISADV